MMNKNEQVWLVGFKTEIYPYCCGAVEMGSFEEDQVDRYYKTQFWSRENKIEDRLNEGGYYSSLKEAWEHALEDARGESDGRPLCFNFVKRIREVATEFDCNTLRELVIAQEDQLFVHSWKNPGSGNIIEQYILTNGSKE